MFYMLSSQNFLDAQQLKSAAINFGMLGLYGNKIVCLDSMQQNQQSKLPLKFLQINLQIKFKRCQYLFFLTIKGFHGENITNKMGQCNNRQQNIQKIDLGNFRYFFFFTFLSYLFLLLFTINLVFIISTILSLNFSNQIKHLINKDHYIRQKLQHSYKRTPNLSRNQIRTINSMNTDKFQQQKQSILRKYLQQPKQLHQQANNYKTPLKYASQNQKDHTFHFKDEGLSASSNSSQQPDSQLGSPFLQQGQKNFQNQTLDHNPNNQEDRMDQDLLTNRQRSITTVEMLLNSKKLRKKFKKALGAENEEDIIQFLKNAQFQGLNPKQIYKLLSSKKTKVSFQKAEKKHKKEKKQKKKKKNKVRVQDQYQDVQEGEKFLQKEQMNDKKQNRLSMFQQSSSDLQIPQQARTIYRNKGGQVKTITQLQAQKIKSKEVTDRLAEWEKGMQRDRMLIHSQDEQDQDLTHANKEIWDDPLKMWQEQKRTRLYQCKYQGLGNRFNIKPGFRWDGVVRGNGYENQLLKNKNLRKAQAAKRQKEYLKNL